MEVVAAETTVSFSDMDAVASVTPSPYTVVVGETTTANGNSLTYTVTVNGDEVTVSDEGIFTTTWTFPETTVSISFASRSTAFRFTASTATEITIPTEHTHVTVNGVETAIDLPGLTTSIEVTDSTNIILDLPEVTTEVIFTEETFEFTFSTYEVTDSPKTECGPYTLAGAAGAESDHCVPAFTTTITLPSAATQSTVFLHAAGLQTAFTLPGITTTLLTEGINRNEDVYTYQDFVLSRCGREDFQLVIFYV